MSTLEDYNRCPFVFVYGTLKTGFGNNSLLYDSILVGEAVSFHSYTMIDLGGCPMLASNTTNLSRHVVGEMWRVESPHTLARLDRLEGHPVFYKRSLAAFTVNGKLKVAWCYFSSREIEEKTQAAMISDDLLTQNGEWKW